MPLLFFAWAFSRVCGFVQPAAGRVILHRVLTSNDLGESHPEHVGGPLDPPDAFDDGGNHTFLEPGGNGGRAGVGGGTEMPSWRPGEGLRAALSMAQRALFEERTGVGEETTLKSDVPLLVTCVVLGVIAVSLAVYVVNMERSGGDRRTHRSGRSPSASPRSSHHSQSPRSYQGSISPRSPALQNMRSIIGAGGSPQSPSKFGLPGVIPKDKDRAPAASHTVVD